MAHTSYMGVKLSELNFDTMAPDALKGYHARKWDKHLRLTIVRGHALLSSVIVKEQTVISMELPEHEPFFLNIISESSTRRKLIEKHINIVLQPGEQIQAVFTTEI